MPFQHRLNTLSISIAAPLFAPGAGSATVPADDNTRAHDQSPGWAERAYAGSRSPFIRYLERSEGLQLDAGEGYRAWLHIPLAPEATRVRITGRGWPTFPKPMHAGSLLLQCAAARPHRDPPEPAIPVAASVLIVRHPNEGPLPTLTGEPLRAAMSYLLRRAGRTVAVRGGVDGVDGVTHAGQRMHIEIPHLDRSVPDPDIALPLGALAAVGHGRPFPKRFDDGVSDTHIELGLRPSPEQAAAARAMRVHCAP